MHPACPSASSPRPWELAGPYLRVGTRLIERAQIQECRRLTAGERDRDGGLLVFVIFCLAVWGFTVGVFELGWRTRFLIGTLVCLLIALTGLQDALKANRIDLHEVEIDLVSGETVTFTSALASEADALAAALR